MLTAKHTRLLRITGIILAVSTVLLIALVFFCYAPSRTVGIVLGTIGAAGVFLLGLFSGFALCERRERRDQAVLQFFQKQGGSAPALLLKDKHIADAGDLARLEQARKLSSSLGTTYGPRGPEADRLYMLTRYGRLLAEVEEIGAALRSGELPKEGA